MNRLHPLFPFGITCLAVFLSGCGSASQPTSITANRQNENVAAPKSPPESPKVPGHPDSNSPPIAEDQSDQERASASGQDQLDRKGLPPELMLAQASERDGKVVVALTAHFPTVFQEAFEVEVNGIKEMRTRTQNSLVWTRLELVLDGQVLRAVDQDDKPLNGKEVLYRLKTSTPVAVYRYGDEDLSLAKAFRDGTVVLKGDWQDMCNNDLLQQAPVP